MRKTNVLFIQSQDYFGADSMIHSLIMRHLDRSRVVVHVACNAGTPTEKSAALSALEGIPDLHIRQTEFGPSVTARSRSAIARDVLRGVPALKSLLGLVAYARKHHIDIVHGTEKPRDAFYGLLVARLAGARAVTHLHVKIENWISPLVRWAMRQDDGLLAVSAFVARSAVNMGYSSEKLYYVLNALDASRWDPGLDGSAIRAEFKIPADMPALAIISRLFPWKGHTELLKAIARAKPGMPEFRLFVVGQDDARATPGGGSYLAQLKQLASELGLNQQVIFTGFRRDVAEILASADVFVMPTFEEPCAVAFIEAMAMGKPVIALDSGGTPELVPNDKAGLLSPPNDIDALAENIKRMISDPELRRQMGDYGRRRVVEYLTPQRMAQEVEGVYMAILGLGDAGVSKNRI
jgi:glycosyltransferase involved in cell wall biosynthesis